MDKQEVLNDEEKNEKIDEDRQAGKINGEEEEEDGDKN